jgi:thymidylate kinase
MRRKLIIYVAGIDGSGKTTLAESLRDSLRDSGFSCKYLWGGWRGFASPFFKPIASRAKKALVQKGEARKVQDAHNTLPLFGYMTWLDYFIQVYPRLFASLVMHDIVLLDRYVYDVVAGLTGPGKRVSRLLFALFKLFPEPSIVFFIRVPFEVAYRRKDDVASVDFLRQTEQKSLSILAECSAKVVILDGTRPINELCDAALTTTRSLLT